MNGDSGAIAGFGFIVLKLVGSFISFVNSAAWDYIYCRWTLLTIRCSIRFGLNSCSAALEEDWVTTFILLFTQSVFISLILLLDTPKTSILRNYFCTSSKEILNGHLVSFFNISIKNFLFLLKLNTAFPFHFYRLSNLTKSRKTVYS